MVDDRVKLRARIKRWSFRHVHPVFDEGRPTWFWRNASASIDGSFSHISMNLKIVRKSVRSPYLRLEGERDVLLSPESEQNFPFHLLRFGPAGREQSAGTVVAG